MSNWATPANVIARWVGDNPPEDTDQIQLLIDDAEAVILSEYPSIQARIDSNKLSESVVTLVVTRMVIRLLRNPENLTYWQQQTGPFGQARNFSETKDIWLTADESNMLAPNRKGNAYEVNVGVNAISPSANDMIWIDSVL